MKIKSYVGIDGHTDNEDFQALLRDVERHCLAGIIFVNPPLNLEGTSVLDEPGIPRVAISCPLPKHPDIRIMGLDNLTFVDKSLDYLLSLGRKRIAAICHEGLVANEAKWLQYFLSAIKARGMECRPYWVQVPCANYPPSARNLVQLLLEANPADRPDGIVIADDNFVEHATAGIVSAGVKVPEQLAVVAHCNFPWPTPSVLPVRRIGYDCRMLLRTCLEQVDELRRGQHVPPKTWIPAYFEDELQT